MRLISNTCLQLPCCLGSLSAAQSKSFWESHQKLMSACWLSCTVRVSYCWSLTPRGEQLSEHQGEKQYEYNLIGFFTRTHGTLGLQTVLGSGLTGFYSNWWPSSFMLGLLWLLETWRNLTVSVTMKWVLLCMFGMTLTLMNCEGVSKMSWDFCEGSQLSQESHRSGIWLSGNVGKICKTTLSKKAAESSQESEPPEFSSRESESETFDLKEGELSISSVNKPTNKQTTSLL